MAYMPMNTGSSNLATLPFRVMRDVQLSRRAVHTPSEAMRLNGGLKAMPYYFAGRGFD